MVRIIGHTGRYRADFAKHIAPRFLLSAAVTYGLRKSWGADGHGCRKGGCSRISRLPRGRPRPMPLNKQKQPRIAYQGCFCKIYHSFINPVPAETTVVRIFKERKKKWSYALLVHDAADHHSRVLVVLGDLSEVFRHGPHIILGLGVITDISGIGPHENGAVR